ncbi:MAG TPA: hypothetical protein VIX11_13575 [Candidatus Acidoferrum sp.]
MASNLVLTPGGYRHPSLVHQVEAGHAIHLSEGKTRLKNLATAAMIDVPEHKIQPGDVPGFGSGWIVDAFWQNDTGNPVTSFKTTWRVPPAPATSSGQTIFLFNGIDPADPSQAILQPVLQWGPSSAGGGAFWSIASWFVMGNGQAFFTTLIPVNPGDVLVGVMTLTGQANGLFSYQSEFQGIPGTQLPVQNVTELVWCNETLEAYHITACSDYPATDLTAMQSINIQTGNTTPSVHWTPQDRVTDCGQQARVPIDSAAGGEVDLYYRKPLVRIPWQQYAQYIQILFGVIHGEGGVGIVNGHIIIIPPRGPAYRLFTQIADGLAEVARGFDVRQAVQQSTVAVSKKAAEKTGLELMAKGLEMATNAVNKAIQEANRE